MPTKKIGNYQTQYDEAYALDYDDLFRRAIVDDREARAKRRAGDTSWSTPVLDAFRTRHKEKLTMSTTKKTATARVNMRETIRFTRNGMPVHESHMLGGIAFHCTEGLGKKGPEKKLDSKGLTELLHKLGVKEIGKPGWEVELPNGIKVGTIRPDQVDEYRTKAKAARASSNGSSTAKKTTAAKKTTGVTKKAAGKTTGASKPSNSKPVTAAQEKRTAERGKKATAAKRTAVAKKAARNTAPAKKTATPSARAKAGVKPIPKKAAAK